MAVKIRLKRVGQKKAPLYRIVVADDRSPRDGRFIEEIGTYDPNQEPSVIKFQEDEAKKWIANGAQPTDRVAKLMVLAGLLKQAKSPEREKAQALSAEKKAKEKEKAKES